jgi:prephenate dehydratase
LGLIFLGETKMKNKIAIQGILGSYHHEATALYFGDENYSLLECHTFKELTQSVKNEQADFGLIAIENSIAGTILPNYSHITNDKLFIIGEIYMPIHHHLMALKGQTLETLKEIQSHPMALLQCGNYLEKLNRIKIVESIDTALSAKIISEQKLPHVGAIASKKAAEEYGLGVLNDEIQTNKENYTRFFIISKKNHEIKDFDKASLRFSLGDKSGSLAKVLTMIAEMNVNLSKIQSVPIVNKPWEYSFFIDVVFENTIVFENMKTQLIEVVHELEILGEYKKGKR